MRTGWHTVSYACYHCPPNGYLHASSSAYGHTFTDSYCDTTAHRHLYFDADASPFTDFDPHCRCRIHDQWGPVKCCCGWAHFYFTARIGTH